MENGNSSSTIARGRLAVLSAHLAATSSLNISDSKLLETSVVSAVVPPPPNVKGALTIFDERTGKKYPVQVSEEGTIKATDLKKVNHQIPNLPMLLLFRLNFDLGLLLLVTFFLSRDK